VLEKAYPELKDSVKLIILHSGRSSLPQLQL